MKFALIDGTKIEATKGAKGTCPCCGSELIAKCGELKINHWAHRAIRNCDLWWEQETEWHRLWKNNFPAEWQEVTMSDEQTAEKHIADVRTSHGLVIEFQHSSINPQERIARENFYKTIIWVVDGTRLKRDYPRFLKGKNDLRTTQKKGIFIVDFPEECFPPLWLGSSVPIIFDFRGPDLTDDPEDMRNHLYCVFPKRSGGSAMLEEIPRASFINSALNGEWLLVLHNFINNSTQAVQANKPQVVQEQARTNIRRRDSPYILERGRWKRRRRF